MMHFSETIDTPYFTLQKQFLKPETALYLFSYFEKNVPWLQRSIRMFGKMIPEPRSSAFYATHHQPYHYSGLTMEPLSPCNEVDKLLTSISNTSGEEFNTVFFNRYQGGDQYMGWHRDNEPELGEMPIIASLNLGASRDFQFRDYKDKINKQTLLLEAGDLFIMKSGFQEVMEHQVPKRKRQNGTRINITFRKVQ